MSPLVSYLRFRALQQPRRCALSCSASRGIMAGRRAPGGTLLERGMCMVAPVRSPSTVRPLVRQLGKGPHPAQLASAFKDEPYMLLLDSAGAYPGVGRYSYLTADPFLVLRSRGQQVEIATNGRVEHLQDSPFLVLRRLLRSFPVARQHGLPPFQGGAAGYLAYDLGRLIERIPTRARDDMALPDMCLGFYDWVLAHDALTGESCLVSTGWPEGAERRARERADWALGRIARAADSNRSPERFDVRDLRSNFTRDAYLAAVRRVKAYLEAGDVYQVNVSQRFQGRFAGQPWALYQALRAANPAPFAAYLRTPDVAVLSASPEQFLRVDGRKVETRPIKGTRPRGSTPEADKALAGELLASGKDKAENVMIVDLLRNDLGRVCSIGSVQVSSLFALEAHPTVFHLVSTITGELSDGRDAVDLLRAAFPGGSVTGAPKIRAMEIIEELEPTRRGVYCGSMGFISFTGDMNTNIAIRTITVRGDTLEFQVGGGIVADSDPEAEYMETLDKAEGLLKAMRAHG